MESKSTHVNRAIKPKPSHQSGKDKPDKAEVILAGALEVFRMYGYAAASMDRIASAAGVSKPTLYNYFQDKEGLFIALVQQLTQNSCQMLYRLPTALDLQMPPEKVLRQIATSVLENSSHNQPLLTLMRLLIGESERFPELARNFVHDFQEPLLEGLTLYLASQPQLQLPDPRVAARIYAGSLMHYLIMQKVMHGSDIAPLEHDRIINGLVHLITARGNNDNTGHNQP